MGRRIRSFDWLKTSLGAAENWPQSLKTTLSILLNAQLPMFLYWGMDRLCFYNDAYVTSFGNTDMHPSTLGTKAANSWQQVWPSTPAIDALPTMLETPWTKDFDWTTKKNGVSIETFWTFNYCSVSGETGLSEGIFVICSERQNQVDHVKKTGYSLDGIASQAAQVVATRHAHALDRINVQMTTSLKQLADANVALQQTKGELLSMIEELAQSEARLHFIVSDAPVAIGLLTGRSLTIETANHMILRLWGKSQTVLGMPLALALPELVGQPFLAILDNVFTSGQPFKSDESSVLLEHDGLMKQFYMSILYQPMKDDEGSTVSILVVATDVTEQVVSRKKVEWAEESLRLAIEAAGMGTFYINIVDRIFVASPRLKDFFGYNADEELPYEAALNQIHPDYRKTAADLVEAAITKGVKFDLEYPVIGYHTGTTRWVRGIGTVQHDANNKASYFTGVLHEVTERKQDDIRKNDFIGMVSHELKTPLTSLNSYIQLLERQSTTNHDAFTLMAVEKAKKQVKRMTSMINGFLNLSRLESGKMVVIKEVFDLGQLLAEMVSETLSLPTSQNIIITHQDISIALTADREKVGSVISNLLSNAIKYSRGEKDIYMNYMQKNDQVLVSVRDEGMGMNEQDAKQVFERYYRIVNNETQHISGFGIGLYLSAEIIYRHGGTIWVDSKLGKGSTFWFSLPING